MVGVAARSLVQRPAVVAARLDPVDLVGEVVAELGGVQDARAVPGEPFDVAVARGVHRRVGVGVVGGGLAVGVEAQDLAAEGRLVLGVVGVARVAGGGPQHPVGAEGERAAVVVGGGGDAGEDRLGRGLVVREVERGDPVVLLGGVVEEQRRVVLELGGDGQAEQAALARGVDLDGADLLGFGGGAVLGDGDREDAAGLALADQGRAVGQERQAPRHFEALGDDVHERGGLLGRAPRGGGQVRRIALLGFGRLPEGAGGEGEQDRGRHSRRCRSAHDHQPIRGCAGD